MMCSAIYISDHFNNIFIKTKNLLKIQNKWALFKLFISLYFIKYFFDF